MASDQHMIETLSSMLQEGETLAHPIFGYVTAGGFQQFAYFGFTETHFLIAYLSSEQVTDVVRIPLDIQSVRIKKSKLFKEYTIYISFSKGRSYRISAFPKVLKIKSQEENFPQFLDFIKRNAKKQSLGLDEMRGKKIRWQYFNAYIYLLLSVIPAVPAMIIMQEVRVGNFDIWSVIVDMSGAIPAVAAIEGFIIGPLVVLSILNRFAFGKLLGVINEGVLSLEERDIPIRDIEKIEYHPQIKRRLDATYATLFVRAKGKNTEPFDVAYFPIYGIRELKRHNPSICVTYGKYVWFLILCPTVISAILGFLLG